MTSRVIPLENLNQRDVMFWLPPGGRDNGVWADTWVILAELEPADVAPILARLHEADIAGYAAVPSGRRGVATPVKALYVDREQHHGATDVVMRYLRNKEPGPAGYTPRKRPAKALTKRTVPTVVKVILGAAFIALCLMWAYYAGPQRFPGVQRAPHPPAVSGVPAIGNNEP